MTTQTISEIHYKRFQILLDYIAKHDDGEGLLLRRKDILNIIGISEGDSAKAIFKIINHFPETYQREILIKEEGRQKRFFYIGGPKDSNKGQTMIFSNAIPIGENRYLSAASAQQIGDWWEQQVITYNPLIQRGEKEIINKDGTVSKEPIFSRANVKLIAEKIMDGSYHTDTIVLNVQKTGKKEIFMYVNGTLTIQDAEINILDGQHRLHSINMVKELIEAGEVTDIDLNQLIFPIQIEYMDIAEAQDAFSQFSRGLKISSTRAEFFNNKDIENRLMKEVMQQSILKDKVETVRNSILKTNRDNVVTFATLINAFKMSFPKIESEDEYHDVKKYLIEFFNELFLIIPELTDYDRRIQSKEHSLIAENFTFYGYLRIASYLMKKPDWKDLLPAVLNISWDKGASPWYGKITRKGKKGYSITNNNDTRNYFVKRLEKEFIKNIIPVVNQF